MTNQHQDSLQTRSTLRVGTRDYGYYRLDAITPAEAVATLPISLKILLENLLRHEDGKQVRAADIEALARWDPQAEPSREIAFTPARVLMQDFTGVPAVVDLAAMRDAMVRMGGDPACINPLSPVELVIDHSVQVDHFGSAGAEEKNAELEYKRNNERYSFLRWGQQAFQNFRVVPPDTGIVHQVNLEYLARCVFAEQRDDAWLAYPDTLVGTDSHTTMINALGVLGWGVGGIEAEAAMLGQPLSMLIPQVVGFELRGALSEGATATDLVLTVTQMLRKQHVVGKFVEFYGDGLASLSLADRATIANMAPEYGATCGIFPVDEETLSYLRLSGRSAEQIDLVQAYAQKQGLWRDGQPRRYSATLPLDLNSVEPSLAGPYRPQDRIPLRHAKSIISKHLAENPVRAKAAPPQTNSKETNGKEKNGKETNGKEAPFPLEDGAVVIAAITSCTNTSNPSVMLGAGLLARRAVERGLRVKPWVKTSLAPGSVVVRDYLRRAGLLEPLEQLGFHIVGYGCTTCIGNSGPLSGAVSESLRIRSTTAAAVLSGNRNFEGRIHPEVRLNFLASPPLVVAYALAGTVLIHLEEEALGEDDQGQPVYLRDLWPTHQELTQAASCVSVELFQAGYDKIFHGGSRWAAIPAPTGKRYRWQADSTYVRRPPFFEDLTSSPPPLEAVRDARVLALLGDSITTDHISPAGAIPPDSPAGRYLVEHGVQPRAFNSFGSRRGNHEVMVRGTFANLRLRNQMAPGTEGGWTQHQPSDEVMNIYDAAMRYQEEQVPLIILAGKEYGTGSSRDWAAKGTRLLGVRVVLANSFERIHRSNLVGMGVLPLSFKPGEDAQALGLKGNESYSLETPAPGKKELEVRALSPHGAEIRFQARVRIDTPEEWQYFQHGGILPCVLRRLASQATP